MECAWVGMDVGVFFLGGDMGERVCVTPSLCTYIWDILIYTLYGAKTHLRAGSGP